jgi:hypothetical protein
VKLLSSGEIAEDRRDAEDNMSDRCRITKPGTGKGTWNPATGKYDNPPARVVVYEGRCRLQVKADINSNVVETTAGEREWTYLTGTLQVPIYQVDADGVGTTGAVRPDHVAEVLAAPSDSTMVGRLFNVQGIHHKSQATHRRFRIKEVIA